MAEIPNLKEKAFKGVFWSYINKFGTQIIAIVPSMVLARLITPEEYGIVAMAAVFSGIAYILSDGGFGNALMQKKEADHLDCCSVFYFNIVLCITMYIIFYFFAPIAACYLEMPEVTWIMRISLLSLILNAFGSVHSLLFRKNLDFKSLSCRNIIVQLISAIVAIILALLGWGYWTLVIQGVLQTLLGTIANWIMCKWRPTLVFSFQRMKGLFGFGSKLFATMLIDYAFGKSYDLVIGKFYSPATLSFYNRAFSTANLFIDTFLGIMNSVSYPAFVMIQNDKERTYYNTKRYMHMACMFVFLCMFTLFFLAEPLFHFLYSSKWDAVLPLFRIACIWGLFFPVATVLGNILMANGQGTVFLLNSIIGKTLVIIVILVAYQYGIEYMVLGQILVMLSEVLLKSFFTKKLINYSIFDIFSDIYKYIILSLIIGISVWAIDYLFSVGLNMFLLPEFFTSAIRLVIGLFSCVIIFLSINSVYPLKGYTEFIALLNESSQNKYIKKIVAFLL